jgi:hypothetical protein
MKNMKSVYFLALLVTSFVFGCKNQSTEPYGTPPVISDIRLFLFRGLDVDYATEPQITEWREGEVVLGILIINDPDNDVTRVSYSYKRLDNNTTKDGGSQYISQNRNPYSLAFIVNDLTPGNWMLTVRAEDKGNNSTTFDFESVIVVNYH